MPSAPLVDSLRVTTVQQEGAEFYVNRWHCLDPGELNWPGVALAFKTFYSAIDAYRPDVADHTETRLAAYDNFISGWTQVYIDIDSNPGDVPSVLPRQLAARVNLIGDVGVGFRPNRGGPYIGPLAQNALITDGRISNLCRDAIGTAVIALDDTLSALTGTWGLGVYRTETGADAVFSIREVRIDNYFDTQRSRRSQFRGPFTTYLPS